MLHGSWPSFRNWNWDTERWPKKHKSTSYFLQYLSTQMDFQADSNCFQLQTMCSWMWESIVLPLCTPFKATCMEEMATICRPVCRLFKQNWTLKLMSLRHHKLMACSCVRMSVSHFSLPCLFSTVVTTDNTTDAQVTATTPTPTTTPTPPAPTTKPTTTQPVAATTKPSNVSATPWQLQPVVTFQVSMADNSVTATLVDGGWERPPLRDKNHH